MKILIRYNLIFNVIFSSNFTECCDISFIVNGYIRQNWLDGPCNFHWALSIKYVAMVM